MAQLVLQRAESREDAYDRSLPQAPPSNIYRQLYRREGIIVSLGTGGWVKRQGLALMSPRVLDLEDPDNTARDRRSQYEETTSLSR